MGVVEECREFAQEVHAEDYWGAFPYSHHLELVAETSVALNKRLGLNPVEAEALAWVHDSLEDHPELYEEISLLSNFEEIQQISKGAGEEYFQYINRVISEGSDVVLVVKLADLLVNYSNNPPGRLRGRYRKALLLVLNNLHQRFQELSSVDDFIKGLIV